MLTWLAGCHCSTTLKFNDFPRIFHMSEVDFMTDTWHVKCFMTVIMTITTSWPNANADVNAILWFCDITSYEINKTQSCVVSVYSINVIYSNQVSSIHSCWYTDKILHIDTLNNSTRKKSDKSCAFEVGKIPPEKEAQMVSNRQQFLNYLNYSQ